MKIHIIFLILFICFFHIFITNYQYPNLILYNSASYLNIPKIYNFSKRISNTPYYKIKKLIKINHYNSKSLNDIILFLTPTRECCNYKFYNEKIKMLNTTFYHFKNLIGTGKGSWGDSNWIVSPGPNAYDIYRPTEFDLMNGVLIGHFDHVILTSGKGGRSNFGHCVQDLLSPLIFVPENIKEKSYVIGSIDEFPFVEEGLLALGFQKNQIIKITIDQMFYCKNLYAFNNKRPYVTFAGLSLVLLREKMYKFFDVKEDPKLYAIVNRKKGMRHILNFNEAFSALNYKYKEINWIIANDCTTFKQTCQEWSLLKMLIVMTGSTQCKAFLLPSKSILCVGLTNICDWAAILVSCSSQHYMCGFDSGMALVSLDSRTLNIKNMLEAVKHCLYHDQYGHWDDFNQDFKCFKKHKYKF